MINFILGDEFQKEFKQLSKNYPSLPEDFMYFQKILEVNIIPPHTERISNLGNAIILPVYKVRKFACKSLQSTSKLRIIYIYDEVSQEIQFIQFLEIYTKSEKDNEDRKRIEKYTKGKTSLSTE